MTVPCICLLNKIELKVVEESTPPPEKNSPHEKTPVTPITSTGGTKVDTTTTTTSYEDRTSVVRNKGAPDCMVMEKEDKPVVDDVKTPRREDVIAWKP